MSASPRDPRRPQLGATVLDPFDPANLASCLGCHRLVSVVLWVPTHVYQAWDPTFVEKRLLRSQLGREFVEAQGFGRGFGRRHQCEPQAILPLLPAE